MYICIFVYLYSIFLYLYFFILYFCIFVNYVHLPGTSPPPPIESNHQHFPNPFFHLWPNWYKFDQSKLWRRERGPEWKLLVNSNLRILLCGVEIFKALRDISPHQSVSKKSEINFLSIIFINFISECWKQMIKFTSIFHSRNILPEEGNSLYVTMCSNRFAGRKGGEGEGQCEICKKKTDALVQVNFPLNIKSKPTNKQANQHRGKKQTNAHVCFEKQSNTTICTCRKGAQLASGGGRVGDSGGLPPIWVGSSRSRLQEHPQLPLVSPVNLRLAPTTSRLQEQPQVGAYKMEHNCFQMSTESFEAATDISQRKVCDIEAVLILGCWTVEELSHLLEVRTQKSENMFSRSFTKND